MILEMLIKSSVGKRSKYSVFTIGIRDDKLTIKSIKLRRYILQSYGTHNASTY